MQPDPRDAQIVALVEAAEAAIYKYERGTGSDWKPWFDLLRAANAATAAAYEVAAREVECGCGAGPCQNTANCAEEDAAAIRALATPDQTAALERLIAEAVADKDGEIAQLNQDLDDMRDNAESAYRRGYWAGGNGA